METYIEKVRENITSEIGVLLEVISKYILTKNLSSSIDFSFRREMPKLSMVNFLHLFFRDKRVIYRD